MKCTFIHAPNLAHTQNQNYGLEFMPTWIFTLANHIPKNIDIDFYDIRFDKIKDIAISDVFLFSGINQDLPELVRVRREIIEKFPSAKTFIGGPICWSFNESSSLHLLNEFDHIVIGDGEDIVGGLLSDFEKGRSLPKEIHHVERFDLRNAKPLFKPFLNKKLKDYFGIVIEVSRGCPFLCEFCDIRIMADNNRAHVKPANLILEDMAFLLSNGKNQFIFACDNFIGDLQWAEEVVDGIIDLVDEIGIQPNIYTWVTLNLAKNERLLKKMRLAGFDLLFIGIESFNVNSLIETAKVQNTKRALIEDIKKIQSFGFIIIAGLIFGFDTEENDLFETALDGLKHSGLLSGDPNFLTALPGTPLYRRMQLAGRLRETSSLESSSSTGGFKHITNIKYLIPKEELISGFKYFVRSFNKGKYQLERLKIYFQNLEEQKNFIPLKKGNEGFASLGSALLILIKDRRGLYQLIKRVMSFSSNPFNIYYAVLGFIFVINQRNIEGRFNHFRFWLFAWSNYIMKYRNIGPTDFDIDSVDSDFDYYDIIPQGYETTATEKIPQNKIDAQIKSTTKGLKAFIEKKVHL